MRVVLNSPWSTVFRSLRKATTHDISLYALLEVPRTASVTEIKRAFRQKAKLYHPDVKQPQRDAGHFARILVAYQVLSNNRQRELYDLSLRTDSSSVRRAAKETHSPYTGTEPDSAEDWVLGDGWFAWATKTPPVANPNQIDKLRAELRTEFNAAVRHAYLGPRVHVGTGELPEAFEGEERSVPGVGDVMQLVSGRQLLGVVRERQDQRLSGSNTSLHHDFLRHTPSGATSSNHSNSESLHNAQVHFHQQDPADHTQSPSAASVSHASQPASAILELVLGDKPVAVAARQKHAFSPSQQAATPNPQASDTSWHHNTHPNSIRQDGGHSKQGPSGSKLSPSGSDVPWTYVYGMDGAVMAAEQEGNIHKGGPQGPHTHTLLQGQTPLVRHMHIVTNASGGKELSICRCRRAWLPPATTWLFPPRSQDHASGGWYFEWSGHGFHRHPAWLHPAVFVLLAGLETLRHEAQVKAGVELDQPAQPKGAEKGQLSRAQQAKHWLRSMLQFHEKQS